jgi:hypothetical protein
MPAGILQVLVALGGASLLLYWISPATLLAGLFLAVTAAVLPKRSLPGMLLSLGWGQRLLIVVILGVTLGATLAAVQTVLYRFLEGYMWPSRMVHWLVRRQLSRKKLLESYNVVSNDIHRVALSREQLRRYPVSDTAVAPTRLGNAIRALEAYSYELFGLDMLFFYEELTAVAPEALRGVPERRKSTVDLYVNVTILSLIFSIAAIVFGILYSSPVLLALLLVYVVMGAASYHLSVISCDRWRRGIEATVNLGRKPLAEALGYTLPGPEQEHEFWKLAVWNLQPRRGQPTQRHAAGPDDR